MGFKQLSAFVPFLVSHLCTSVVFSYMQQCYKEAAANRCPPFLNSDSWHFSNPLQFYLTMMFVDDASFHLRSFFPKLVSPTVPGDPPKTNIGFQWFSKVYRMAVEIAEGCDMLSNLCRDAVKWPFEGSPLLFLCQVNNAIGFSLPVRHRTRGEWINE